MPEQKVQRNSVLDGQRGRKKTAARGRRRDSVRACGAKTGGQGIAARPHRGRPRVGRNRPTGSAPPLAAPALAAHLAPSRPGTRGKAVTVRDSTKPDQAPGQAIGPDLKRQDRRHHGPVNSDRRIRKAIGRDLSGPEARDRLQATAEPDPGLPIPPVLPAAKAWPAPSRLAPANPVQAGRGPAVSQASPPGARTAGRGHARRARQALGQPGSLPGSPSPIMEARAGRRQEAASGRRRKAPADGRLSVQAESGLVVVAESATRASFEPPSPSNCTATRVHCGGTFFVTVAGYGASLEA
jgi:hypothetical protein